MMWQMKKIKNTITIITAILIILLSTAPSTYAQDEFDSIAYSAILTEASTGKILYEKNADIPMPPASITKIMTLLLGFEALKSGQADWNDLVHVSEKAWRIEGSDMFLEVGMKVPFSEIITGISVVSANDGCIALAEHLYGTEEAFVQQMNKRAKELGLTQTHFKNSSGLPAEGHYMSARDIAVLSRHLITNYPKILEIESITEFTFNNVYQKNRNPLLENYPGADGLKTGWTNEAGYCLVGTAQRDGMRLISVVLKTNDTEERLAASKELLDFGYRNFDIMTVAKEGDIIDEIDVKNGKELTLPVKIDESIETVIPKGRKEDIKISVILDDELITAPVAEDVQIGSAEIRLDDEVLATAKISTAKAVEKAGFFEILLRNITNFLKSLFKVSKG